MSEACDLSVAVLRRGGLKGRGIEVRGRREQRDKGQG